VSKGFIAGTKNIGVAHNGSLQNWVVVPGRLQRQAKSPVARPQRPRFQKHAALFYGFFRKGPSGLNVRVGHHTPNLNQNRWRKDKHIRPRYDGQKKIAGESLR
jgi:hypothetical protein